MYNQNYEEYMRSVLGYMPNNNDMEYTYDRNDANMYYNMPANYMQNNMNISNIEDMYPEIYKIVYPMIRKSCSNYMGKITEENVERMTMEIFTHLEEDMSRGNDQNVQNKKVETKSNNRLEENRNQSENRNRNSLLRDLIRILILRELVWKNRPPRPPFPGPRPPFPGPRPPFSGPGMPIQPRAYEDVSIY